MPKKTSPYDFYQYWRNVDDPDVKNCLALLTFLPMDEVNSLGGLSGEEINKAKEILAYEVTKLVHGESEAQEAQQAAKSLFGNSSRNAESIPATEFPAADFQSGKDIMSLLVETGLTTSKSDARRMIQQGGIYIEENRVEDFNLLIKLNDFKDNRLLLRKGKKIYHVVKLK